MIIGGNDPERLDRLAERLDKLDDGEDGKFRKLAYPVQPYTLDGPLLVIVHPGDVLASSVLAPFCDDYQGMLRHSFTCQRGMAPEIAERLTAGWDVVVLHRASSSQFAHGSSKWLDDAYAKVVQDAEMQGAVLYGDELEKASAWMIAHLSIAKRPKIFLAGAYSDPENGCVTKVAECLGAVATCQLTISRYSPVDNGGDFC